MRHQTFNAAVIIGRFQPFHNGHYILTKKTLEHSDYVFLVCGSANHSRCGRNPWTLNEREAMIRSSLSASENKRVVVCGIEDNLYNQRAWVMNTLNTISAAARLLDPSLTQANARWGLVHAETGPIPTYYRLLNQWQPIQMDAASLAEYDHICGSDIREHVFAAPATDPTTKPEEPLAKTLSTRIPTPVWLWLQEHFLGSQILAHLRAEQQFIYDYKKLWAQAPYPPNFVTVDALVEAHGHVLLVERGNRPGKGLLALPGGFLDPNEAIQEACLRELQEETGLNLDGEYLTASLTQQRYFDAPYRSARGRTITHVLHFELPTSGVLPEVKGGDDARLARWFKLSTLNSADFFEDHHSIIRAMLGI